jgi:hypothetical protein
VSAADTPALFTNARTLVRGQSAQLLDVQS